MEPSIYAAIDARDLLLVRQVTAADRAALAELYRSYYQRLARFFSRITRRNDLVEEVINNCFWIVWQKAAEFRGDSRVSTWIMGRCAMRGDWTPRMAGRLAWHQKAWIHICCHRAVFRISTIVKSPCLAGRGCCRTAL